MDIAERLSKFNAYNFCYNYNYGCGIRYTLSQVSLNKKVVSRT